MPVRDMEKIKIAFIGGGSQVWAPTLIRDIVFKKGMEKLKIEFELLDIHMGRAKSIKDLFDARLQGWGVDRVSLRATTDPRTALLDAHFVIVAISTGRLEAMAYDLAVPERYGIYHTVGDTAGPGGWSRALRNIPVFKAYAQQINELAPKACVINYSNPMGVLTKVLSDELGNHRVIGLCHGIFECYDILQTIFNLDSEKDVQVRFGGVNHFFWILDFTIRGEDGYSLLREKLNGRSFPELVKETHADTMGWSSNKWLAGELFDHYSYLPYLGDRHTCEFFTSYMTSLELQKRLGIVRTTVDDREKVYRNAAAMVSALTAGKKTEMRNFTRTPSRETAADIIKAVIFNEGFCDVANLVNTGQIPNLPEGAVVETMGYVDGGGFTSLNLGNMPEALRGLLVPHAVTQLQTVKAGLSGDRDAAIMALAADPACAHMAVSDVRKMGMELLEANRKYLPQFFNE